MVAISPVISILRVWLIAGIAASLCSCSSTNFPPTKPELRSVRNVQLAKAPELNDLAGPAHMFGDEMYPKICSLLLDESSKPPRQFDLIIKPLKSRNTGEAHLEAKRIYIHSDYLTHKTELQEHFA